MRIVLPVVASIVILGLIGTQEANAEAVTNISTCQNLSIPGETYVLTRDIVTTGNCFIITADGITLDGNGHKIVGDGSGILGDQAGDIGVDIISATGVTVQNLDISFFRSGVFLQSSNGNTVTNNLIHQISKYGVGLDGSSNNIISSNFFDTSQNGVHAAASESNGNTITLNTFFQSNHVQVHLHATNDNNLVYHNNFLELTGTNILDECSGCNNQYSVVSGGNYYDDYDEPNEGCNDTNSDGFCDDPFVFSFDQDNLPWVIQNGWDADDLEPQIVIPSWIKNTANWWSEGVIADDDFTLGIQYMMTENIISIPDLPEQASETVEGVPAWVRNNAGWWAAGLISDDDFVFGIKYLVEQGIIQV